MNCAASTEVKAAQSFNPTAKPPKQFFRGLAIPHVHAGIA
jgi:hypothetical protein